VKVLFLVTRLPVPPWRGDQVRAFHHLRELAPRHDITCCALVSGPPPAALRASVEELGVRLEVVPIGRTGAVPALLRAVVGDRRPLQVLLYDRGDARHRVARLVERGGFDVVHAQLVRTAACLPEGGPPVVLDLIDALSANLARRARQERGPLAPVAAWEAARLARFEPQLMARAARTLVVSAAERDAIGGERVVVVANGVDLEAFPFSDRPRPAARLLFFGNLGYFPNVDAARWLAAEIYPRVRAEIPGAELRLVGARPARAVRALARRPGISLAAGVPAMAPEVAGATVAVVPMRAGTGLQNKVLEAMAVGTPVVATPSVAAGLDVEPGRHLLVAAEAAGLAGATISLLRDGARARSMAEAARALVARRYRWAISAAEVERAWLDATAGGG
jgi:sugar transferase (PEP-CTERM/EpsH1 system associated)